MTGLAAYVEHRGVIDSSCIVGAVVVYRDVIVFGKILRRVRMKFLPACILLAAGCYYVEAAVLTGVFLILLGIVLTFVAFCVPSVPYVYSSVIENGGGLFELLQPSPEDKEDSGGDFDYE